MGLFDGLFANKKQRQKELEYEAIKNEVILEGGVIDARDGHHVDVDHLPKEVVKILLPDNEEMTRNDEYDGFKGWTVTSSMAGWFTGGTDK
jgi:hypothetical protein